MIKLKSALLILATICVLALCFALPGIAAKIQDGLIAAQTESISKESVALSTTSEDSIIDLLNFSGQGYEVVDYEISASPEDIAAKEQAALAILSFFEEQGHPIMPAAQITDRNVRPFLARSSTNGSERLLWTCTVQDALRNYAVFIIDGKTEKMLSFQIADDFAAATYTPDVADEGEPGELGDDEDIDPNDDPEAANVYSGYWPWQDSWQTAEVLARYYGFASVEDVLSQIDGEWDTGISVSGTMMFADDQVGSIECGFQQQTGEFNFLQFNNMTTTFAGQPY